MDCEPALIALDSSSPSLTMAPLALRLVLPQVVLPRPVQLRVLLPRALPRLQLRAQALRPPVATPTRVVPPVQVLLPARLVALARLPQARVRLGSGARASGGSAGRECAASRASTFPVPLLVSPSPVPYPVRSRLYTYVI